MATQTCEPGDSGDVMWPGIKHNMFREIKKGVFPVFAETKYFKVSVLTKASYHVIKC